MIQSGARAGRSRGFTLLEVLIAMSILAVGATSILAVYLKAVQFATERKEQNRLTEIYNHAHTHAQSIFDAWDPAKVKQGDPVVPAKVDVDVRDPTVAKQSGDPMVREAGERFPGFRYVITFEDNELAVAGSSVLVHIEIFGLSGLKNETFSQKEFLTRAGAPVGERYKVPSVEEQKKSRDKERRGRG